MPILKQLLHLYKKDGYSPITGLSPRFCNNFAAEYTFLFRDGKQCTNHLGIALQELYFFECLFQDYKPANILVIGNSFAWSTFALSLLNPTAQVVAMDIAAEQFTADWIAQTNLIAQNENMRIKAVKGTSPDDVAAIAQKEFKSPIDFAFIDGNHTISQLESDFMAVHQIASKDCVYLLHDILGFDLLPVLYSIAQKTGLSSNILYSTSSGMALVSCNEKLQQLTDVCSAFGASDLAHQLIQLLQNTSEGRIVSPI